MMSTQNSLPLDDVEQAKMWFLAFEAHCRTKCLKDEVGASGTSPLTDRFLERCGHRALLKIVSLLPGSDISTALFADIKKAIFAYLEPAKRLILADRTNFLQMVQDSGETVVDFLARLNEASSLCQWETLSPKTATQELVKLRFIAGLNDPELKLKILERCQLNPSLSTTDLVEFCQVSSQLKKFVDSGQSLKPDSFHLSHPKSSRRKQTV